VTPAADDDGFWPGRVLAARVRAAIAEAETRGQAAGRPAAPAAPADRGLWPGQVLADRVRAAIEQAHARALEAASGEASQIAGRDDVETATAVSASGVPAVTVGLGFPAAGG
jgi:hypothetical protein